MTSPPVELPLSQAARSAAALRSSNIDASISSIVANDSDVWSPSCELDPWPRLLKPLCDILIIVLLCLLAWQSKPMKQNVTYDNQKAVEKALQKLESLPPLVTPSEVNWRR